MTTYDINNKTQIRDYLCRGINPGKTLRFSMFGEPVIVTLTYDSEMEDVYLLKCLGSRKYHYDFNNLVSDMERVFDALRNS